MTKAYLEKMIQFVTAAFGLAAGLAWNEAIQALIKRYVAVNGDGLLGKLIYAVILTVIAVTATMSLSRAYDKIAKKEARAAEKRHEEKYHSKTKLKKK